MKALLQEAEAVRDFCHAVRSSPFLALDTEFERERRYYARLCILQIAALDEKGKLQLCAIDALSRRVDWQLLEELICNESVVKVFHAARQDLEIFQRRFQRLPAPIFDTQLAAGLLGFGAQCGYERLARHYLGVEIDKGFQFVDWSARPLPQRYLSYALDDVRHLASLYPKMRDALDVRGRLAWLEDVQRPLRAEESYDCSPDEAWWRFQPRSRGGGARAAAALRRLWLWREQCAQRMDKPRTSICSDNALGEIALARPRTLSDMEQLRSRGKWRRDSDLAAGILAAIEKSLKETIPRVAHKQRLNEEEQTRVTLLRPVLRLCAQQEDVAEEFLATREDLEEVVRGGGNAPSLQGWRATIFGEKALRFLRGEIAFCIEDQKPALIPCIYKQKEKEEKHGVLGFSSVALGKGEKHGILGASSAAFEKGDIRSRTISARRSHLLEKLQDEHKK